MVEYICGSGLLTCGGRPCPPSAPGRRLPEPRFHPSLSAAGRWKLICDFESTPLFSSPIISAKNPKDCCELNHPAGPAESQTIQSGAAGGRADFCLLICDFESTPLFSSPIISAKNPKDCCELNHPAGRPSHRLFNPAPPVAELTSVSLFRTDSPRVRNSNSETGS